MKIEPFGEKVAVKIMRIEETTESGLIMATNNSISNRGQIVSLGEEVKDYFKVGDKVVFVPGAGISYTDGSDEYKILNSKDILCRIIEN